MNRRQREFEAQKPHQRLGDAPVQDEYHAQMTAVVTVLDEVFNQGARGNARKTGFVLLVFPYGNVEGRCNYMSNGADRRDVLTLMREMVARFEGQPEMKGTA